MPEASLLRPAVFQLKSSTEELDRVVQFVAARRQAARPDKPRDGFSP